MIIAIEVSLTLVCISHMRTWIILHGFAGYIICMYGQVVSLSCEADTAPCDGSTNDL